MALASSRQGAHSSSVKDFALSISSLASMESSVTPKARMSSESSALPNPKPWGVWPMEAIFSSRIWCLILAAPMAAFTDPATSSSSGEPKIYSNSLSLNARKALPAENAPVREFSLRRPPSITGSLRVHSRTGQVKRLSTSLAKAALAKVMFWRMISPGLIVSR